MIRRLIILLLIVGCGTEPEDCAGVAGGNAYLDECGGCDANVNNDCIQDECGVWGGDNSSCLCGGLTEVELWGVDYDIATTDTLHLYNQELTGSIPPEIGCLTNLTGLDLGVNQLTGEIPLEIGNLTNLTWLSLSNNQITGSIPPEIGNLTNLLSLYLAFNQLSGDIPPEVCDLIESNNLNMGYILYENNLTNTCE